MLTLSKLIKHDGNKPEMNLMQFVNSTAGVHGSLSVAYQPGFSYSKVPLHAVEKWKY